MSAKEKLSVSVRRTIYTVRNFLLTKKSREFLIFLFFFLVASFFWLLQTLDETYETEISIPVKMENVPEDVLVTLPPPEKFQVVVKDRGAVLVNYMIGRSFYPVIVNFKNLMGEDGHARVETATYQKNILSQLLTSSQVISIKPENFEVVYSRGEHKKLPVRVLSQVSAEKQYYVSDVKIQPDSVTAYAPKEILDTLKAAYTNPFVLKNVADTVRVTEMLKDIKGVKFSHPQVDVTFYTDMYTEKKLEIPIRSVNFPENKELKTFPSKVTVTFQVGLARFRQISEKDFAITVSYDELMQAGSGKYKVRLTSAPSDVSYIRLEPSEVDFIIEQRTLPFAHD